MVITDSPDPDPVELSISDIIVDETAGKALVNVAASNVVTTDITALVFTRSDGTATFQLH